MPVSLEKIQQAQQLGRSRFADQHRVRRVIFQKPDPAQDQRANDALAEIGLGNDQRPQLLRRDQ